ncbi:MAG: hypothetical protein K8U57_37740 [Planctomycetes bacterium]|nr:hypothetical protein [Planctomycetota bacterium]
MCSVIPAGQRLKTTASIAFLLLLTGQAVGQQPAPRPADKLAIDMAVDKGVKFLRESQNQATGLFGPGTGAGGGKGWGAGYTALAGIALIECGVPNTDPGLKKALIRIRAFADAGEMDDTYEVALAILFLDRMGGGKPDRTRIQILAARLMAGQTMNGGWGYKVPKLSAVEYSTTISALKKMSTPQAPFVPSSRDRPSSLGLCIKSSDDVVPPLPPKAEPEKSRADALRTLSATMKAWPIFLHPNQITMRVNKEKDPAPIADCNSNTHFAMLAVWAARKHEVPVEQSLTLLAKRFRTSQNADGTWGYSYGGGGTRAMTCVGLLGMAIGHVVDPEVGIPPEKDPKVVGGFAWLSKVIGAPVGTTENRPAIKEVGGLYYMWAMERIAVIYDVTKLDKKDWHLWGAEILLCHQKIDGSWEDGGYHGEKPVLNTALALLFLRRANLTPDLSRRFTIDTSALTAKVAETVTPVIAPEPPRPEPMPEPIAIAPSPREVVAKVTPPTPTPPAPTPQVTSEAPRSDPPKESSGMIWIILGIVLVLVLVGALFFLKKKNKEEEEKPKKKKKKKVKAKVEVEEDDE